MRSILYQQKSWKMIDTINGATISAIIYSIAGTAKANILKPYAYFCHLLPEIPTHMEDKVQSILGESVALVTEVTREHHETKLKPFTASRESDLQLSRYLLYCIYENYTIIVSFTKLKFKQCPLPPAPSPICKKSQGTGDTTRRCQRLHPNAEVHHMCCCVLQGRKPRSNTFADRLSNGLRNAKTILI